MPGPGDGGKERIDVTRGSPVHLYAGILSHVTVHMYNPQTAIEYIYYDCTLVYSKVPKVMVCIWTH